MGVAYVCGHLAHRHTPYTKAACAASCDSKGLSGRVRRCGCYSCCGGWVLASGWRLALSRPELHWVRLKPHAHSLNSASTELCVNSRALGADAIVWLVTAAACAQTFDIETGMDTDLLNLNPDGWVEVCRLFSDPSDFSIPHPLDLPISWKCSADVPWRNGCTFRAPGLCSPTAERDLFCCQFY